MICWSIIFGVLAIYSFSKPSHLNGDDLRTLARIFLVLFLVGSFALWLIGPPVA